MNTKIDCITNAITDCFEQQDFKTYIKSENLLIKAAKGDDFHAEHDDALSIYRKDFDDNRFQIQLVTLSEYCKELVIISVRRTAEVLKNLKVRSHLTEVIKLAKLILVMKATNSTSERSFSLFKLIKTYLPSAMKQSRLNHLMILSAYKSQLDQIDLIEIISTFADKNEGPQCTFGRF